MNSSLQGKVVLVSGGSRGLGLCFIKALLNEGCRVATFSRSFGKETEALQKEHGEHFFHRNVDARDEAALRAWVTDAGKVLGGVDALVNNAALAADYVLPLFPTPAIHDLLSVNVVAAMVLAREVLRSMLLRRSGVIVNIASILAIRGFAGLSVYGATKAALHGFTLSLAREVGGRGIRVNTLAPGYLSTEMSSSLGDAQRQQIIRRTPLGRLGLPEDVYPVLRFLLSDDSAFMTGQMLVVDGGATT